jgi:hypothetical protein
MKLKNREAINIDGGQKIVADDFLAIREVSGIYNDVCFSCDGEDVFGVNHQSVTS